MWFEPNKNFWRGNIYHTSYRWPFNGGGNITISDSSLWFFLCGPLILISSQFLNTDCRGTTDDFATISSLSSAAFRKSPNSWTNYTLMLCFMFPLLVSFTDPCKTVFAMREDLQIWPYHLCISFFTVIKHSNCVLDPITNSQFIPWSLKVMFTTLR